MLTETRRRRIMQILIESENAAVSVERLAELLNVSSMTIRRDLDWLQARDLLQRVHGGAIVPEDIPTWKPFRERRDVFSHEKQLIGRLAAQLVHDGERIIIDSGTTTLLIAHRLDCHKDLVAITNSLPVAEDLGRCNGITVIMLGGLLKPRELCCVGPMVTDALEQLSVDRLFLSASGFDPVRGVTDPDLREVEVKRAMIRAAREVVLVADSSKWGQVALAQITPFAAIHTLVVDSGLPPKAVETAEALGVRVLMPSLDSAFALTEPPSQITQSEGPHP